MQRIDTAMSTARWPKNEKNLAAEWSEVSESILSCLLLILVPQLQVNVLKTTRDKISIVHQWWVLVDVFHDIFDWESFIANGPGMTTDQRNSIYSNEGLFKKTVDAAFSAQLICQKLKLQDILVWKQDPQDGWFALMSARYVFSTDF
jgi:hypothetical protein